MDQQKEKKDNWKYRILFVCLGNICRSPAAEEILKTFAKKEGLQMHIDVDSAGLLSYHQGELPDARMRMHAARRGYNLTSLSRPIKIEDFDSFDLIIGMDERNLLELKNLAPDLETEEKVHQITEFSKQYLMDHVPDPYYEGATGFELVLDLLEDACKGLLDEICSKNQYLPTKI